MHAAISTQRVQSARFRHIPGINRQDTSIIGQKKVEGKKKKEKKRK
jgi:hypothetical protein